MLANSKIDLDAFDLQTSRRSHLAYQKISTKPNEFTPCARKEAFNQYVRSLEKNDLFLHTDDLKNFQLWHYEEYSKKCTFVYIFLDKEDNKHTALYVGKTKNLRTRMTQHASKDWYKYANCLAIEPYESNAIASEREAELIHDLTPLFNKQGGLGMAFQKAKNNISVQVPKMADVSTLKFAPISDSIAKYKLKYGAMTRNEQEQEAIMSYTTRPQSFKRRHLKPIEIVSPDLEMLKEKARKLALEGYNVTIREKGA